MEILNNHCECTNRCNLGCVATCLLVAAILLAQPAVAQVNDARLPIVMNAESTKYDGKQSMLVFQGLRVTQGNLGIQADSGRASKLDFEDSIWQFSGNVIIDTEQGHIECESADLEFNQYELQMATISGNPATFKLRRAGDDNTTYAEAKRMVYDFKAGVVEFSGNAVITKEGNRISSSLLVYNIEEQRINAQSAGEDDARVKITYTPRTSSGAADDVTESDAADGTDDSSTQDTDVSATPGNNDQ